MLSKVIRHALMLLIALMAMDSVMAQQDELFTRAQAVIMPLNAAYAGHDQGMTLNLHYRNQWSALEGTPRNMEIHGHMPLKKFPVGIGFRITNDLIGVTNTTTLMGYYSYRIPAGPGRLSFGLNTGLSQYTIQLTRTNPLDEGDPNLAADISKWVPEVGFGMLYEQDRYMFGISIPQLLENSLSASASNTVQGARQRRHYYGLAAARWQIAEKVELEPTVIVRYASAAPLQGEASLAFVFGQRFRLGGSYRSMAAVSAFTHIDVTPRIRIGYAYDISTGAAVKLPGSHEVLMRFSFGNDKREKANPRIATPRIVPGL